MSHTRNLRIAIGFTFSCCISAMSHAQERIALPNSARPQPAVNRAAEAVRREAEAGIKQRENDFAKLKALRLEPPGNFPAIGRGIAVDRAGVAFPDNLAVLKGGVFLHLVLVRAHGDANDEDARPEPRIFVAPETFDLHLFGSTGDAQSARAYLRKLLTGKIDVIDGTSRLAPAQRKKLLLAGRGDIERLLEKVEDERKTFEQLNTDLNRCQKFLMELEPLRRMIRRGPFGPDSLLSKTLNKMRDEKNLVTREPILELRAPGR